MCTQFAAYLSFSLLLLRPFAAQVHLTFQDFAQPAKTSSSHVDIFLSRASPKWSFQSTNDNTVPDWWISGLRVFADERKSQHLLQDNSVLPGLSKSCFPCFPSKNNRKGQKSERSQWGPDVRHSRNTEQSVVDLLTCNQHQYSHLFFCKFPLKY